MAFLCRCNSTAAFDGLSDGSYVFRARQSADQPATSQGVSVFSVDSVLPEVQVRGRASPLNLGYG